MNINDTDNNNNYNYKQIIQIELYLQLVQGEFDGFGDVLDAYNDVTPKIGLGGPTNFAPLIREAIEIVKKRKQVNPLHNNVSSEPGVKPQT